MATWTFLLFAYAIWTFACLLVAIPLKQPDPESWHWHLVSFLGFKRPDGNCGYFWRLWFTPIFIPLAVMVIAIGNSLMVIVRLAADWIYCPLRYGQRVEGVLKMSYWKDLCTAPSDSRHVSLREIPGKRFLGVLVLCSAFIAWVWVGKISAFDCLPDHECRSSLVGLAGTGWLTFSVVGIIVLSYLIFKKTLGQKIKSGWEFISGKLCRKLEYPEIKNESE